MNAPRPDSLRAASTHASVAISRELLDRLRSHALEIEQPMSDIVDELVRNYLDEAGPYAEVAQHVATINRLGAELELLAKSVGFVLDSLPRFARSYTLASDPNLNLEARCTEVAHGVRCVGERGHAGPHLYRFRDCIAEGIAKTVRGEQP